MRVLGNLVEIVGGALIVWDLWRALELERAARELVRRSITDTYEWIRHLTSATIAHLADAGTVANVTATATAEVKHGMEHASVVDEAVVQKDVDEVKLVRIELAHVREEIVAFRDALATQMKDSDDHVTKLKDAVTPKWPTFAGAVITVVGLLVEILA